MRKVIAKLHGSQKRKLRSIIRRSRCSIVCGRARALLAMSWCATMCAAAQHAGVARSMAYKTRRTFLDGGIDAICFVAGGRDRYKVTAKFLRRLDELVNMEPSQLGWVRSRWSSELLASQLEADTGVRVHSSYLRRLLLHHGYRYRRPKPYIRRLDPRKAEKLRVIQRLIKRADIDEAVIYEDEVDVHLLPRMGCQWTRRGVQPQVGTPGVKSPKRYLAGGIDAHTGDVFWCAGLSKNSALFFQFLMTLARELPEMRRIHVVADNYIIHKSKTLHRMLEKSGVSQLFNLVFLPTYGQAHNPVERLWKCLHDTVTRNHKWLTIDQLMDAVGDFMDAMPFFPGARHGEAKLSSV
jgi:putative transposase